MTQETVLQLIDRFEAGGMTRLEYRDGAARLVLEKGGCARPAAEQPAPAAAQVRAEEPAQVPVAGAQITAPVVGSFYRAPDPDSAPFVQPGAQVKKGQTVALIEAMKMITEVPAPCDCVIGDCLVEDGALVGFDQPLFSIREM